MEIQINIKCHYYGIQFIDNTVSGGIINKKIKKRLGSIQFVKALKGQSLEHLIVAPCSLSGGDTVSMNEKQKCGHGYSEQFIVVVQLLSCVWWGSFPVSRHFETG